MTKKFIYLTDHMDEYGTKILVSVNDIAGIEEIMPLIGTERKKEHLYRKIHMTTPPYNNGWLTFDVKETIEEIQKMIKEIDEK